MAGIIVVVIIALVLVSVILFMNLSPEFGGKQNPEKLESFSKSPNYEEGIFINQIPTSLDIGFRDFYTLLRDQFISKETKPPIDIVTSKIDSLDIVQNTNIDRITWFGHSTFLLEMQQKKVLLDPMLGKVPAPHPWLGNNRFSKELPIEIAQIPAIDVVVFSHDHYDHLDYGSVKAIKDRVGMFLVPLGLAAHLEAWGVSSKNIKEHDWWDETTIDGVKYVFTPSRHFSGRGISDRAKTLWGSWVINGNKNVYFSGDGGYGPHFKEIGDKLGPFDFAMIECGQYDSRWKDIHMIPEESAQAALDIGAKVSMPIHWGAFKLAFHTWDECVTRIKSKADALGVNLITPRIGEQVGLDSLVVKEQNWWNQLNYE